MFMVAASFLSACHSEPVKGYSSSGAASVSDAPTDPPATDPGATPPAGEALNTKIVDVPGAPYKVTSCAAVVTQTKDPSGNNVGHLWVKISYANTSARTITATQTQFHAFDAFNNPMTSADPKYAYFTFTLTGNTEANTTEDENYNTFDSPVDAMSKVTCKPIKAQFKDGGTWSAPVATS